MPVQGPRAAVRWPFAGPDDRAQRCGPSRRGQASTRQNWTICTIAVREVDEGLVRTDSAIPRQGRTRAAIRSVTRTLASALVSLIMSEAAVAAGVRRRRKTRPAG